jgi:hypothetical protein
MIFNFYNTIIEQKNLLLEQESKYIIHINFSQKARPTKKIDVLYELTPEEYSTLNKRDEKKTSSSFWTEKATEENSTDKRLYKLTYPRKSWTKVDGERQNLKKDDAIAFCYFDKKEYQDAIRTISDIDPEQSVISLEIVPFEDLYKITRREIVGQESYNRLYDYTDFSDVISKFQERKGGEKRVEKQKAEKEKGSEEQKSNLSRAIQSSEEEFGKYTEQEKEEGSSVYYNADKNDALSRIIKLHQDSKLTTRAEKDRKQDVVKRDALIKKFVDSIKSSSADSRAKEAAIYYSLYVKMFLQYSQYSSVFLKIVNEYKGIKSKDDKDSVFPTEKEKEDPKVKKFKSDSNKNKYFTVTLGDDWEYKTTPISLTDSELDKIEKEARINFEEYRKDKKAYDKWLTAMEKGSSEPMPKIKKPKDYGVIGIVDDRKKLKEMSTTGGGAGGGDGAAFVTPGEGEGVATRYSFAKSAKKKKTKISEEYNQLKNDAKMIFLETIRGYIKNK